jgi:hypothetical protein
MSEKNHEKDGAPQPEGVPQQKSLEMPAPAAAPVKAPEPEPEKAAAAEAQEGAEDSGAAPPASGGDLPEPAEVASLTPAEKKQARLEENKEHTALARVGVDGLAEIEQTEMMPFSPNDFEKMWRLADKISNSGIVPKGLEGNAGGCFAVMARGTLMGLHWSVAIQVAYVVEGRVGWPADVMAGLVDSSPDFEYFDVVEADGDHAVVEAKKKRWDAPRRHAVTIEDARRAKYLDGKHSKQWELRPFFMLTAMARREAARLWDPKRFAGIYTPDELEVASEARLAAIPRLPSPVAGPERLRAIGQRALAASGVVDVDPSGAAVPPGAKLSPELVRRVRLAMAKLPVLTEAVLAERLGCSLDEFEMDPGTDPAVVFSTVLEAVSALKKAFMSS